MEYRECLYIHYAYFEVLSKTEHTHLFLELLKQAVDAEFQQVDTYCINAFLMKYITTLHDIQLLLGFERMTEMSKKTSER